MIQGATLDAAFADPQDVGTKVSLTLQIAIYVCLSRVKELVNLCVLQPLSPLLFRQGPPPGPHRLLRKLEGTLTTEAEIDEWCKDAGENRYKTLKSRKRDQTTIIILFLFLINNIVFL